ncbi:MAG: hypothetical protein AAFZ04_13850 [Pseudomonadota bacterium]
MTGQFTFKTVRNRRPYFAARIHRRGGLGRLDFSHALGAMAAFDGAGSTRLAA